MRQPHLNAPGNVINPTIRTTTATGIDPENEQVENVFLDYAMINNRADIEKSQENPNVQKLLVVRNNKSWH